MCCHGSAVVASLGKQGLAVAVAKAVEPSNSHVCDTRPSPLQSGSTCGNCTVHHNDLKSARIIGSSEPLGRSDPGGGDDTTGCGDPAAGGKPTGGGDLVGGGEPTDPSASLEDMLFTIYSV